MANKALADNYRDLSTELGFQFEFYCERCHDAYRSEFAYHKLGVAAKILRILSSFTGGLISAIGWRSGEIAEFGQRQARDSALAEAVLEAESHFHRCGRCSNHFCDKCWNHEEEICMGCAPHLESEIASAKRAAAIEQVHEEARKIKHVNAAQVAKKQKSSCPECGHPTKGGKFCENCGSDLTAKRHCPHCKAELQTSAKFCPECGKSTPKT